MLFATARREPYLGLEVILMGGEVLTCLAVFAKTIPVDPRIYLSAPRARLVLSAATMRLFPKPVAISTSFAEVRDVELRLNYCIELKARAWLKRLN